MKFQLRKKLANLILFRNDAYGEKTSETMHF